MRRRSARTRQSPARSTTACWVCNSAPLVCRGEPDPGQVGSLPDGPHQGRHPASLDGRSPMLTMSGYAPRCGRPASRPVEVGFPMKSNRLRRAAVAFIAVALVAACSALPKLEGDKIEYKSAGKLPPLDIPPDLTRPTSGRSLRRSGHYAEGAGNLFRLQQRPRGWCAQHGVNGSAGTGQRPHRAVRQPALAGGEGGMPTPYGRWSRSSGRRNGFIVNVENPESGVMETDWAENRARVPDIGAIPRLLRQDDGQHLFDCRARQVPHAPRTRAATKALPRSTSAIAAWKRVYTASEKSDTKWQPRPARSRSGSRNAAPVDGSFRRAAGPGQGGDRILCEAGAGERHIVARRVTAPASCQ